MIPEFCGLMSLSVEKGLVDDHLFEDYFIGAVAADLETNLLYFRTRGKVIYIATEQGELIHYLVSSSPACGISVSCDIILTNCHEGNCFVLYNRDDKQITEFKDERIEDNDNVCLVRKNGIVVTFREDKINIWRVV
jgi:hypothetical protein